MFGWKNFNEKNLRNPITLTPSHMNDFNGSTKVCNFLQNIFHVSIDYEKLIQITACSFMFLCYRFQGYNSATFSSPFRFRNQNFIMNCVGEQVSVYYVGNLFIKSCKIIKTIKILWCLNYLFHYWSQKNRCLFIIQ